MGFFDDFFESVVDDGDSYLIKNFPIENFNKRLKKAYKTTKLSNLTEIVGISLFRSRTRTVKVHKFFIPELVFLLRKFNYPNKLIDTIIDNTWLKIATESKFDNRVDFNLIKREMNVTYNSYQSEFISQYDLSKQKLQLNGGILALDTGLGKTLTSLGLMTALNKKKVIIFAPKTTLESVWENEIDKFYKNKKRIFIINKNQQLHMDYDYYIFNYESMDKIKPIVDSLSNVSESVGIIVDESHNFLRKSSKRTKLLIDLKRSTDCQDILLMSGTPVKALGIEIMPMLFVLDSYFDDKAMAIFKKALGVNTTIATDVIRNRLHSMMFRKTKEKELNLPPKNEETIKIKIPNGDTYTLSNVKRMVQVFIQERQEYHREHQHIYLQEYYEAIDYLKTKKSISGTNDFLKYLEIISEFRNTPVNMQDPTISEKVQWSNTYEKNILIPALPKILKKKFVDNKSAIKYVHLKIRGEVLGGLLSRLRIQMTSELVAHSGLKDIIKSALKKTVIFTSYVDTIETAEAWCKDNGFEPLTVYGKNSNDAKYTIKSFMTNNNENPLIASIKSLATGVTLTIANTMVFLNKPWRHTEVYQASDRIYRIGQDTEVFIYTIILDTGEAPNLSTSAENIVEWSKNMFEQMVH